MTPDIKQLHERIVGGLASAEPNDLKASLTDFRAADIAEAMDLLTDEQRSRVLYALPPRTTAEVVVMLDEAVRGEVVEELDEKKLTEIVTELPPDDAADVMAELSLEQFDEVLEHIPKAQSDQISELLSYEQASAGGIMNPRALSLPAEATVAEAVRRVRDFAVDEDLHFVYVVDGDDKLVGIVPLRRLVVNTPETRLDAIYDDDPVTVLVNEDQEEVLQVMRKYDLAAIPVTDRNGKLVGRVTYDDVMDVAEEEAAEDIYRMAGTDAAELETHSPVRAARVRMAWLVPCMIGTAAAAGVIASFGDSSLSPAQLAALLLFIPMIAATSGNAGIQVSAIIVRGFATGEMVAGELRLVALREVRIAALVAVLCASLTALVSAVILSVLRATGAEVAMPQDVKPMLMGLAAGLGMFLGITGSVTLGITLPFLFRRFGVDPAIASGPLITSANDLFSVAVYLSIALAILT